MKIKKVLLLKIFKYVTLLVVVCRKTSSDITKSAIASINYDCLNKEDSTYSLGLCKQEFLSCKNGRAAVEKCNAGYFYNVATRLCTDLLSNPSCNPIPMRNEEFETRGLPSG